MDYDGTPEEKPLPDTIEIDGEKYIRASSTRAMFIAEQIRTVQSATGLTREQAAWCVAVEHGWPYEFPIR